MTASFNARSTRVLTLALVLALWFAGTMGLLHRTLHVPGMPAAETTHAHGHAHTGQAHTAEAHHAHLHAHAGAHAAHEAPTGWALFGAHADAECRLYDQLAGGVGAPAFPPVVLPIVLPAATFAFLQGAFVARWVALFDARGPPSSR